MRTLLLSIPLLPFLAGIVVIVLPPRSRLPGPIVVAATAAALRVLILLHGSNVTLHTSWFTTGRHGLSVGLALNGLTWSVAVVVAGIALAVTLYSNGYMAGEIRRQHFFAELGLFIGAMLTLVLANSLILMFIAWEMVGLASYLLIGFHHREPVATRAAAKAFLMTRVGDTGFLIAWLLVFLQLGTTDIDVLLRAASDGALPPVLATLLALLFLAAAIGKSAQLPLSIWLPEAMVAPTPVSALLHSATMVAAGAYLVLRLYPLFAAAPAALDVAFWVGITTAMVAALLAMVQMDLKRVLAWSTISQLGEMLLAIGLHAPLAAALHLSAHACFKSTLFMAAGSIDRYAGTRDLREIGGMWRVLPITSLCLTIGAFSLAGIQPLFTETSHDAILAVAVDAGMPQTLAVLALLLLAGVYIGRIAAAVLGGPFRVPHPQSGNVRRTMQLAMIATAVATALITLLVKTLPSVLPFGAAAQASIPLHLLALGAGCTGLIAGTALTLRRGPAWFAVKPLSLLEIPLAAVAHRPARIARKLADFVPGIENGLDTAARTVVHAVVTLSGADRHDSRARGLQAVERGLDRSGSRATEFIVRAATGTERTERKGFGAAGDTFANVLQAAGQRFRMAQTGKLYLYTLGLFIWMLVILIAAGVAYLL